MTPSLPIRACLSRVLAALAVATSLLTARGAEQRGGPWIVPEASLPEGFPAPGPIDEVIVKSYPAHRLARVRAEGGGNGMFMRLFRHIERHDIKMTAPVEMSWQTEPGDEGRIPTTSGKEPAAMAFLYGKASIGTAGVDPDDARVVVEDVPAITVASVGLRGAYEAATFDRGAKQLARWLQTHPEWEAAGGLRTLAYNSPFVPNLAKYAEVQLPLRRRPE